MPGYNLFFLIGILSLVASIELGYFQMEKLTNLDKVPSVGATIYCFPIKIARASAGWVRAVATIPE